MIESLNPVVLMAGASLFVITAGGSLYAADRRVRAARQRISHIATTHSLTSRPVLEARRPWTAADNGVSAFGRMLAYLGVETDRPDLYPMPWWAIFLFTSMVAVAVAGAGGFFMGSIGWLSLPIDVFFLARVVFGFFKHRRSTELYTQLPDALAMTVRSVRAGFTVQDALRIVGEEGQWPTSTEFRRVIDEIRLGTSLQDALVKLAQRSALLEYRFLAVALSLQSQSGGSLSETLENLADVVRKRVALKQRGIALASEARTTMYVLGALPFVVAGALMVLTPEYLIPLVTTSGGKKLLFIGIALLGMGFWSMKMIIKKSVS
jgi:tight adherence protein B